MRKLLRNQLRLFIEFLAYPVQYIFRSLRTAKADFVEWRNYQDVVINKTPDNDISVEKRHSIIHNVLEYPQIIAALQDTTFPEDPVRITFAGPSRKIGNPNHNMEQFLKSVIENAKDINQVEVLLGIDGDEDFEYFIDLKNRYKGKMRLRIFVSPIQFAYERLHMYDTVVLPHMAKNSRMMGRCTDDCVIVLKHFDEQALKIDSLYPDNIYFLHTRCISREKFLGDVSQEINRMFWIFHTPRGCHSYFPIISTGVLQGAHDALQYLPDSERANWSPYANSFIVDCYVDTLGVFLKAEGVDRIHELEMIDIRHGLYVDWQHKLDHHGLSANDRSFIAFLGLDTQQHLRRIAHTLALATRQVSQRSAKSSKAAIA